MLRYQAHGLAVDSNRPIPELIPSRSEGAPDVRVRFGETPAALDASRAPVFWFDSVYQTPAGLPILVASRIDDGRWLRFDYADGPTFLVDAPGTTIWVNWPATLTIADTSEYLLGPIFGIVLRLRGLMCLHASAVEIDEHACAFLGPAGAGKSTMAGSFAGAGFRVLSDDTVTLTPGDRSWFVAPGYPRLRLWPDALGALEVGAGRTAAAGEDGTPNRYHFDLAEGGLFAQKAVPLRAVYVIEFEEGLTRPHVDAMSPAEVLPVLAANTFANRVLDRGRRAQEFETLADILSTVPVRRLTRAPSLAGLAEVRDAVLDDMRK